MRRHNKYLEALKEQENLVGIAACVSVSLATLNPVPLLAGAVAEAAYLLFVPDSEWYARRNEAREAAARERRFNALRDDAYHRLDPAVQARFDDLERTSESIRAQVKDDDQDLFSESLSRLDYLLEKFLVFALKRGEFDANIRRMYAKALEEERLESGTRRRPLDDTDIDGMVPIILARYEAQIAQFQEEARLEQEPTTRSILEKRVEVLKQRQTAAQKMATIQKNLTVQLGLLDDSFGLVNDQICARSPDQVLADIDSVVQQADTMTQVLEQMAPLERLAMG